MQTFRRYAAGMVSLALLIGPGGSVLAQAMTEESPEPPIDGQAIAERVNEAVASCGIDGCDEAMLEAAYDPDIRLIIDGVVLAEGLEELTDALARGTLGASYDLLLPVAEYRTRDGDLYVALFVEVTSPYHRLGDPIVSFMQVRDGKVIRQVDTTPPFDWAARPGE